MLKNTRQNGTDCSGDGGNNPCGLNEVDASSQRLSRGGVETKRQTYYILVELIEKIRAYAYWERLGISEVINCALEEFFAEKKIKPIPKKRSRSRAKG